MPTGYTAGLKDMTFEQFAFGCARAFGACIELRDEPRDKPIPECFEPSDYHLKAMEKASERLAQAKALSIEEAEIEAANSYAEQVEYNRNKIESANALLQQYEEFIARATTYSPPSENHVNFKEFMIEQLKTSVAHDCDTSYYEKEIKRLTPQEWIKNKIEMATHDVEYHKKEYAEEVKRTNGRNEWIRLLRESLPST